MDGLLDTLLQGGDQEVESSGKFGWLLFVWTLLADGVEVRRLDE